MTNKEPYISMQENENESTADCGCIITAAGNLYMCGVHDAAPKLLIALKTLSRAAQLLRDGKRDGAAFGNLSLADDRAKKAIAKAEGRE